MSLVEHSMKLLRKEGWMVDRCEQWVVAPNLPMGGFRRDCFNLGDLVGVHPDIGIALFQVTSRGQLKAHWDKLLAEPFEKDAEPLSAKAMRWLKWGHLFFHGWDQPQSAAGLEEAKTQGNLKWRVKRETIKIVDGKLTRLEACQFLKHDPVGRTILCLLADGQISLGKAAQAITEKFCLGLEPTLPEWTGSHEIEIPKEK
jgi:hypothetical protein